MVDRGKAKMGFVVGIVVVILAGLALAVAVVPFSRAEERSSKLQGLTPTATASDTEMDTAEKGFETATFGLG
jgi:hypothetical protein